VVKEGTQDPDSWYRWEIRFGVACVGIGQRRSRHGKQKEPAGGTSGEACMRNGSSNQKII
jgi:hypothetical protein